MYQLNCLHCFWHFPASKPDSHSTVADEILSIFEEHIYKLKYCKRLNQSEGNRNVQVFRAVSVTDKAKTRWLKTTKNRHITLNWITGQVLQQQQYRVNWNKGFCNWQTQRFTAYWSLGNMLTVHDQTEITLVSVPITENTNHVCFRRK